MLPPVALIPKFNMSHVCKMLLIKTKAVSIWVEIHTDLFKQNKVLESSREENVHFS